MLYDCIFTLQFVLLGISGFDTSNPWFSCCTIILTWKTMLISFQWKLHFTTLNYTTITHCSLHPKLSECTISTLNYNPCYTLHHAVNSSVILDGITWKNPTAPLLNSLKTYEKLHFITLNYTLNYTLQSKLWFSIQDYGKINGRVQSVAHVIV